MNKTLIDFYTDVGTDTEGRTHNEILGFSDEDLEKCHNFIQWTFPTKTPSKYNDDAPILDFDTLSILKDDAVFQARFSMGLKRMFNFWKLDFSLSEDKKNFIIHPLTYRRSWMEIDNHNLLRMTRVMESCRLLGYRITALNLLSALLRSIKDHPEFYFIEPINIYWWYCAATGIEM